MGGEEETGPQHRGGGGVRADGRMARQDRRPKDERRKGGKAGQPGRNYLPFIGRESGNGRMYK